MSKRLIKVEDNQYSFADEETETLNQFKYNPATDRLEALKPIETTLSSLYLGNQHSMSSGNENVFFKNYSSDVNWSSSWSGVKDQSVVANRDYTGLINMSARLRSSDLQFVEVKGAVSETNTTTYQGVTLTSDNLHVNGVKFKLAESLSVGEVLKYKLYVGSDNTGNQVFEQDIVIDTPYNSGDFFEFWFEHPDEARTGTSIFAEIIKVASILEPLNSGSALNVYSIASDPNNHWIELRFRTFEDVNISLDNHIEINSNTTHLDSAQYLVDTTSNTVDITIPYGVIDSFVVSDTARKFNSNNCHIKIMNSDGVTIDHELRLTRRDKTYMFYFDGLVWKYRDVTKGQYVAIASVHVDTDDFSENEEFVTNAELDSLYIGYLGNWDASTNTPDISALSPNVGYYFDVSVEGTYNGVDYKVNDQIKWNGSDWDHREHLGVRIEDLEDSTLNTYDIYVKAGYTGTIKDGTALNPFDNVETAVLSANDGDSIFLDGVFVISSAITLPSDKSIYLYGDDSTEIKYASYNVSNDKIFYQSSSSSSKEYFFSNIKMSNSGDYAVYIRSAKEVKFSKCEIFNNGWSGQGLSTISADNGSTLGYDSDQSDLQAFYAGDEASNGGAMRIRSTAIVNIVECKIHNNLRGLRIQDCGVGGYGYISRNQCYNNIESGIYLASGSYNASAGCENFTVYNNASKYNANNGILVIGGINNVISLNVVEGNWNAGIMGWHASNTRFRDMDLTNNNRSQYNGIGNVGDAHASISIAGGTINPLATFIIDILDTQVYNTGLGSNTSRVGLRVSSDVSDINDVEKSLINIDDVGFKKQDYAVDLECDLDKVRLTLGDCRYIDTTEKNVKVSNGYYYELPFSNHHTNIKDLDLSLDSTTSQIILKEGVSGDVLNVYGMNTIQAVAFGSKIRLILKDSHKIQLETEVANTSINGSMVNSVLAIALVQINDLFTNTSGFASGGNPVTAFALTDNNLTLTLQDGTSFSVDVTTLGVDENKFVTSGALNGSNLELTMNDSSIVTIDASNMINGSSLPAISNDWFIAYGSRAGEQIVVPTVVTDVRNQQPFYNGDFLEKGQEYIWTHDDAGFYGLGIWSGIEDNYSHSDVLNTSRWSTLFRFKGGSSVIANTTDGSVGIDIDSRFSEGYAVTNSTVFSLRYGNDNYLYLYDISDVIPVLIARTNSALVGDSQTIYFGGNNQPNARFPVMVKRTDTWQIVADFDNSEDNEWSDGIEPQTIIKSNVELEAGYKYVWQLPNVGNNRYYGIDYLGASTGETNPASASLLTGRWRWHTTEIIQYADDWTLNTSNSHYDDTSFSQPYWYNTGSGGITVSYRYNTNNVLEMWDEDSQELIMTYDVTLDGSPISLFFGSNTYTSTPGDIPNLSIQELGQGSQPVTSFAPDINSQSFDITEGEAFNVQIALDAGSDIVNQYVSHDAPSWAVLNQATGVFNGTAPAWTDNGDSYAIQCSAANAKGGSTEFIITLNVVEQTYTNTKSLKFEDGDSSYLSGNGTLVSALERAANGSGSSDAWSISFWLKGSTHNSGQTIFYFGPSASSSGGYLELKQTNHNGSKRLRLRYGTASNYIQLTTPSGSISPNTFGFQKILLTYDGGTTGDSPGDMSDYYSRFKIFIDGALQATSNTHSGNGYTGSIVGDLFRVGRFVGTTNNYLKDMLVNQLAIWSSDQSSNAVALYNTGNTQDLTVPQANVGGFDADYLAPDHYYEIESSVSDIPDLIGSASLIGFNFDSSDLVDDAP